MARRRALIIANFDYLDPSFRRLISPARDAQELARVLSDSRIGNFEVESVINQNSAIVCRAIEDFFVLSKPAPDDLLLMYFSGHGVTDEDGQLYLTAIDSQIVGLTLRRSSVVGQDFVRGAMQRSRSRRQVLVLDCCHSGAFAEGLTKSSTLPELPAYFQGKGKIVLAASTARQFSLECLSEADIQPSVYTRVLVKGLESGAADLNRDGFVSLDELHNYLYYHVPAEAPAQTPTTGGFVEGQLYIAENPFPSLPDEILAEIASPLANVRTQAVARLAHLIQATTLRTLADKAVDALQALGMDRSRRVAHSAGLALSQLLASLPADHWVAADTRVLESVNQFTSNQSAISSASDLETLEVLLEASHKLKNGGTLGDALQMALEAALRVTGARRGYFWIEDPPGHLSPAAGRNHRGDPLTDDGAWRQAIEAARTSDSDFVTIDERQMSALDTRSMDSH